ncbi:MAG: serine protease inhibitor, partial [Myxococcota bacterium]
GATLVPISGVFQMKPVKVRINRPFMFVILSGKTGGILFMGRVLDPRGQPELESER